MKMHRLLAGAWLALSLAACAATPAQVATQSVGAPAPLSELVAEVDIPYDRFVLDNGLTTIVHTDRKAPIVGVTVYYRVGNKHEPRGKTGFAHLYEHLFFGGSANVENFDKPLEAAGSTTTNGTTWYDRTNYVETVPTGTLELALFMESDRMGYLLPAITQEKLDRQRGVVQNEKRQGDNQPYALMDYAQAEGLFPVGHPYRHDPIGSMADLEAATLVDVRNWFRDNYGPNNVVLVLTGDIDGATARPMIEKWFGEIPRGPDVVPVQAGPVTLAEESSRDMTDDVPVTRLTLQWTGPGLNHPDAIALEVGMHVLGGLASSRLDNELVRGKQQAVRVSSVAYAFEQVGIVEILMDVKPDVDRAVAEASLDKVIADYLAEGPTKDELTRAVTSMVSGEIAALERVGGLGGKGTTLAEGELYSGDPLHFRKELAHMAALTPAEVRTAMDRWLTRPVYRLATIPGERTETGEDMGGWGDEATQPPRAPDPKHPAPPLPPAPKRVAPAVGPVPDLDFPDVERATLSNGIPVALARRTAVPMATIALLFDAGISGDVLDAPGTQHMMMAMLDEGAGGLTATEIAEAQERLGASIGLSVNADTSRVTLSALTANLGPSLDLMATLVRNPDFAVEEVARVKAQKIAGLAQTLADPRALARRELYKLIYGAHPYAQPSDGLGSADTLEALTADDLRSAHDKWLRPDLARITVVGDVKMEKLLPELEAAFGDWSAPDTPAPAKAFEGAIAASAERIVLIDRPGAGQSVIAAGKVLPVTGMEPDSEALGLANEVLGGGFLSRLNDELREVKGWSYGAYSGIGHPKDRRPFLVSTAVQSDRTGDSVRVIREIMSAYPGKNPIAPEEMERIIEGGIRGFAHNVEANSDVLFAIMDNDLLGRPDDYYETLASRYRALDATAIEQKAATHLGTAGLTWVIVGDADAVMPQLAPLGLPVELRAAGP